VSEAQSPPSAAAEIVLAVDDEVIARMVISEYLRQCGYMIIEAADTDEALAVLQQLPPSR
jgi:CheY-like chemotaxis protein